MKRGLNSSIIDNEYRRRKAYEKKMREKCKDKECLNCKYSKICIEGECKNEEMD